MTSRPLILLAALAPFSAFAQTPDAPLVAPEVVVSGGLTPVPAGSFARANTVITAEEIERRNPRTIEELLRTVPGVAIARSGGPGGITELRLRGAEANQVLILIDGVEQANSASNVNLGNLRPELIERIEVVRGPQSALFGSGATAGTINIITKGGQPGFGATAEVEVGTATSAATSLLLEGGTEAATGAISLSFIDDDGWDTSGTDGEEDGMQNLTFNARGQARLAENVTARMTLRAIDRETEFDGTSGGCGNADCYVVDRDDLSASGTEFVSSLAFDIATLGGALVHTPSASFAAFDDESKGQFGSFDQEATTARLGFQSAYTFGPDGAHTVTGGLQYRDERFESTFSGGERKREQIGLVLDYQGQITEALFVQAGARWDENDTLDDFLSFGLSASYNIFSTGTRLRASVGRAQTNPEFFQQFSSSPPFIANPDLKPEQNFGFDLGIDQSFWGDRVTLGVTYFNETLSDAIVGAGNSVTNAAGETDRQGFELELFAQPLEGLTLRAAYTFLDIDGDTKASQVRRPEHSASAGIIYSFLGGRARIGADLTYVGETVDADFADPAAGFPTFAQVFTDLDAYAVVDLTASYAVTDRVEIYGSVKNLFDEEYSTVLGYAEQPLTGFLGLRARF